MWNYMDVNGNGLLSLAEVDKGMRDVIQLPALFKLKPVLMRAFTAAKTYKKSKTKHDNDYITRGEFRILLKYLRQYYEYWVGFDRVDGDDDRRVSKEEFVRAIPLMEQWGLDVSNPDFAFRQADKDGHGMILFIEFCDWAIRNQFDL